MKRQFRAHPLMIFSFIKPFLLILLIPVARGIIQYLKNGEITQILGIEIFIFIFIIVLGFFRWRAFRLVCDNKTVTVRDGVVLIREAAIPISGLSSVQSEQTPWDFIFRTVTFRINTEAGSRDRTDYSFKLSRKDANEVASLLYGKKKGEPVRFSPVKIAILAAATSSAFTGMLVGVPILNSVARLVGVGVNEVMDQINSVSDKFQTYFPPIVNTATIILLGSFVVSFVYSFLKYISFRVYLNDDRIEVRSGFFVMLRTSFKKSSVNNVKIEQTFLMRILRRYAMKVNVGGYGEAKSESQVLVPSGRYSEIMSMFADYFPFLEPRGRALKSKVGIIHENRYVFWSEWFLVIIAAVSIIAGKLFPEFIRLVVFCAFVAGLVLIYYTYLCIREYHVCQVALGDTIFARGKKGLRSVRLYCPKERVGDIKLIRYPPDFLFKTCNVKITVRSETAEHITIRHLDFEETKKEIFECYGIKY